ncbi:hypothetical protein B7C52_12490 [Escherichia coli]|nr:hypothetical protein B7C52_12490 [Escherichia coli]
MEHISITPDYRQAWKVVHKLSDILLLTICAVISGAEGWEDIEDFGETHLDFLKQYGDFENGIPVHDTIARVVSDPLQGRYITQDPIGLKGGWNLYTYPLSPVNSMDPLGLYEFKSKNIDDIGIFALAMCNGESINENKEYGGLICKKQGEYFPMNPISSNDNDSVDLRNIKCPEGSERVGDYHTHGFYSDDKGNKVTKENDVYDSLNFSSKDLTNSYMNGMGKKEYSSYLGTPNNTYLKYNPKAKGNGVTIIRQGSN